MSTEAALIAWNEKVKVLLLQRGCLPKCPECEWEKVSPMCYDSPKQRAVRISAAAARNCRRRNRRHKRWFYLIRGERHHVRYRMNPKRTTWGKGR